MQVDVQRVSRGGFVVTALMPTGQGFCNPHTFCVVQRLHLELSIALQAGRLDHYCFAL